MVRTFRTKPVGRPARSLSERFWEQVNPEPNSGCWLWDGPFISFGYGHIAERTGRNQKRTLKAHRVSWEIHHGPIPDGLCVLHKCDTPACVNPDHLILGTNSDNVRDRDSKQRQARGERNGAAKLTEQKVRDIRVLRKGGLTQQCIADMMGVNQTKISNVLRGETWKHVA